MGQEILRGNLADFGFALHRTTKISNKMEKFKMKIRLLMILFMRDIWYNQLIAHTLLIKKQIKF